jgi:signal transduction histidine kinase/DNA-binding response OmpR family regulator/ligand-binding sensor domain-containing protein
MAQSVPVADFRHWGVENGLSHRDVLCVFEDSRGFIWIGTKYGLNRFDGYGFRWFTKQMDGLSSDFISNIQEDGSGNLWLFSYDPEITSEHALHVDILNTRTLEVKSFDTMFGEVTQFRADQITSGTKGEDNALWLGTVTGNLLRVDPDGTFRRIPLHGARSIWPYEVDVDNQILAGEPNDELFQLIQVDQSGNILKRFPHNKFRKIQIAGRDSAGRFWYAGDSVLHAFSLYAIDADGSHGLFEIWNKPEGLRESSSLLQFQAVDGILWCISGKNSKYTKLEVYSLKDGWKLDLSHTYPGADYIRGIRYDSQGRVWIYGTFGLSVVRLSPNLFKNYLTVSKDELQGAAGIECRGITQDNSGNVYVSSYSGVFVIPNGGMDSDSVRPKLLSRQFALAASRDKDNRIWLGTGEEGLRIFEGNSSTLIPYNFEGKPPFSQSGIWSIFHDEAGGVWCGGLSDGIVYLAPGNSRIEPLPKPEAFKELWDCPILDFFQDREGTLWVGSGKGLYIMEMHPFRIRERYWSGGEGRFYLPFDDIYHIHQDKEGIFWLATGGGGLIKWNKDSGEIRQFTRQDGLSSNVLYGVFGDDHDRLWISSDYGIICFDKENYRSYSFLPANGLSHHEFNRISHFQAPDGRIWFGGLNGVTSFHPDDFEETFSYRDYPLEVTAFRQFVNKEDRLVDETGEFLKSGNVVLRPGDLFFNIEFALLSFLDPANIRYAWMVEGIDRDWLFTEKPFLRISGLPYGTHVLRIKGQLPGGQFSREELSIPIRVLRPFYLQAWFIVFLGGSILIAIPAVYFLRIRNLKHSEARLKDAVARQTKKILRDKEIIEHQTQELLRLDEAKSRFFANVSHELRTPITLMVGPLESLLSSRKNLGPAQFRKAIELAVRNGKKLQRLTDEILEFSRLEAGKLVIEEKPENLASLLLRIGSSYDSACRSKGIIFSREIGFDSGLWAAIDASKLEKILDNLLSNAIKFTPEGKSVMFSASISGGVEGEFFEAVVEDTGAGIHPDDLPHVFDRYFQSNQTGVPVSGGTGIGLAFAKELSLVMKGELFAESRLGEGSRFTLRLPLKRVSAIDQAFMDTNPVDLESDQETNFQALETTPQMSALVEAPTLLIVEDNPDMQIYIQSLLETEYNLLMAEHGGKALEILKSGVHVDLVSSDVMMPVMDGFELLERLKSNPKTRNLPVLMLTARAAEEDRLNALSLGVDDYMLKPFSAKEMKLRIGNLIDNYRRRKEWLEKEKSKFNKGSGTESTAKGIPEVSEKEQTLLKELEGIALREAGKAEFSVGELAAELAVSERQLYRLTKTLTGLTPKQYLQEARLSKARHLLENKTFATVTEVATAVGYDTPEYFSRVFEKQFGIRPIAYM